MVDNVQLRPLGEGRFRDLRIGRLCAEIEAVLRRGYVERGIRVPQHATLRFKVEDWHLGLVEIIARLKPRWTADASNMATRCLCRQIGQVLAKARDEAQILMPRRATVTIEIQDSKIVFLSVSGTYQPGCGARQGVRA